MYAKYKDTLLSPDKKRYLITRDMIYQIINKTDVSVREGLHVHDLLPFFEKYKIQVRVFDVYRKLIFKYDPPSINYHNKPFYVLNDGDHIYLLDDNLHTLKEKMHTDDDTDADEEIIMEGGAKKEKKEKVATVKKAPIVKTPLYLSDDDEDEEDNDDQYLQKFDAELNKNYVVDFHPECSIHNYEEITILTHVVRDNNNNIIDDLHRTIPFLTKFEKARVLGQRAKQLSYPDTKPFIKVPENVIDGYIIAELELQQKRIPFIIRRPFPGGGSEYWNLRDLEIINF